MKYGDRDSVGFKEFQALAKARGYEGKWDSASHFFVKSHISNIKVEYHFYKNSTKILAVINYVPPAEQTDEDRENFRKIENTFKGTKWKFLILEEAHIFGARNETLTGARYIDFNDDIDEYFNIADHCKLVPIIGGEREEPIKWEQGYEKVPDPNYFNREVNLDAYIDENEAFLNFVEEIKPQSKLKKSKTKKLRQTGKQTVADMALNEGEIENIFDMLAEEFPDL